MHQNISTLHQKSCVVSKTVEDKKPKETCDDFESDHEASSFFPVPRERNEKSESNGLSLGAASPKSMLPSQPCSPQVTRHFESQWKSFLHYPTQPAIQDMPLKDQLVTLIERICQPFLNPNSLAFDGKQTFQYLHTYLRNGEYAGIESDIQNALDQFQLSGGLISVRSECCQIDPVEDGVRIIIYGVKGESVSGASSSYKPHNLVFFCDTELNRILGYRDFIISTHDQKNTVNESGLREKPNSCEILKYPKEQDKRLPRTAFMQPNGGVDLAHLIAKNRAFRRLDLEARLKIVQAVLTEFHHVIQKQWAEKKVFTDGKAQNALLSIVEDQFVVTFIDYVEQVTKTEKTESIPATMPKLPTGLISDIQQKYLQDPEGSPFFQIGSKSEQVAYHPMMAYVQIVVLCMEVILGQEHIHKTTKEDRLRAKQAMDDLFQANPSLTEIPYFAKYYETACGLVIEASSFMCANG